MPPLTASGQNERTLRAGSLRPQSRGRGFDLAVFLSVGTGSAYAIAWYYLAILYDRLGVDHSFLTLRPEDVFSTVFPIGIVVAAVIGLLTIAVFRGPTLDSLKIDTEGLLFLGVLAVAMFAKALGWGPPWVAPLVCVPIIVLIALAGAGGKLPQFSLWKPLRNVRVRGVLLLVVVVTAWFGVAALANRAARLIAHGEARDRVHVVTDSRIVLPDELVIVGRSQGFVVFYEPSESPTWGRAYVVNEREILDIVSAPRGKLLDASSPGAAVD